VAGIRPGDLLLEYGGREVRPPNDLTFSVCESANLLIEKLHGEVQKVNVQLPMPKSQKHPVTALQAVTTEKLSDEILLLRVAMFPGAIGIDVAKDIDGGIAATRRMQSAHCRSTRQYWRWSRRATPDELFDTRET
jgi:hypothetical protein